ncbi:hypothetical protein [Caballeronia udeis]|uniref:hypothetical protein n=1 Tax=Caballeronia udeis TaxID=1232866 RepID=UPI000785618E
MTAILPWLRLTRWITDVYLLGILQKATGHDSTGQVAVASVNTLTPSNTDKIAVVRIGIRHKF